MLTNSLSVRSLWVLPVHACFFSGYPKIRSTRYSKLLIGVQNTMQIWELAPCQTSEDSWDWLQYPGDPHWINSTKNDWLTEFVNPCQAIISNSLLTMAAFCFKVVQDNLLLWCMIVQWLALSPLSKKVLVWTCWLIGAKLHMNGGICMFSPCHVTRWDAENRM